MRDLFENRIDSQDLLRLVDNINRTHDDSHIWQYRLNRRSMPLQIVIEFKQSVQIALLRVWNYNKSRIHSFRGVKNVQMRLDDNPIFSGEIAKASGELLGSVESFGDVSSVFFVCVGKSGFNEFFISKQTILFTTNEDILDQISKSDAAFQELMFY